MSTFRTPEEWRAEIDPNGLEPDCDFEMPRLKQSEFLTLVNRVQENVLKYAEGVCRQQRYGGGDLRDAEISLAAVAKMARKS